MHTHTVTRMTVVRARPRTSCIAGAVRTTTTAWMVHRLKRDKNDLFGLNLARLSYYSAQPSTKRSGLSTRHSNATIRAHTHTHPHTRGLPTSPVTSPPPPAPSREIVAQQPPHAVGCILALIPPPPPTHTHRGSPYHTAITPIHNKPLPPPPTRLLLWKTLRP